MGYMHINNLYKDQRILAFKQVYALEKVHGSSAHVAWRDGHVWYSAGGESEVRFKAIFDDAKLREAFEGLGHGPECPITVYGEVYGGSCQKQSWRYGKDLKFVAFDVKIGDHWLDVPKAADVASKLGIDFVSYKLIDSTLGDIDVERDALSEVAIKNAMGAQPREGVVLRPPFEVTLNNGERLIAKHKREEERETATPREVVDPARQKVLDDAAAIAEEWVTETRLQHVLQHLRAEGGGAKDVLVSIDMKDTPKVIEAMVEDVYREAKGEIVESKEARRAIGARAAKLFRDHFKAQLAANG